MLSCTTGRLDLLMAAAMARRSSVFHYLPFCFAGSWILLLSCLSRDSLLTLSTDLTRLADEMRLASPDYFLNVPALLERIRSGVEEASSKRKRRMRSAALPAGAHGPGPRQRAKPRWALRRACGWLWRKRSSFRAIRKKLGPQSARPDLRLRAAGVGDPAVLS